MENRVIYSDNGTLRDLSVAMNNYHSMNSVFNYVKDEDYLFIGSRLPFNNIFFKMNSPNTVPCAMSVDCWDGSSWVPVVECIDETEGFTKSGHIQFTPNRSKSWSRDDTNDNGSAITGLGSIIIYDRYWIRISFSESFIGVTIDNDPDPDTNDDVRLSWVGNIFSNDYDLSSEFPDLVKTNVLTSFSPGKTSWEEQSAKAAQVIIQDLIDKQVIKDRGQILDWREFTNASVQKTAEIIFASFGNDFVDQGKAAREEYKQRISKKQYRVDLNNNAIEDVGERFNETGFLSR